MKKIIQFGYSVQLPEKGIPLVDCRCIPNPYEKTRDRVAARYMVRNDPNFQRLVNEAVALLEKHDVIGIGCGYGVHRSGAVVEELERMERWHKLPFDFEIENIGKDA